MNGFEDFLAPLLAKTTRSGHPKISKLIEANIEEVQLLSSQGARNLSVSIEFGMHFVIHVSDSFCLGMSLEAVHPN